jgi:hypothetical protein
MSFAIPRLGPGKSSARRTTGHPVTGRRQDERERVAYAWMAYFWMR